MHPAYVLFNAAGARLFAYGTLSVSVEAWESFQAGNIVGGLVVLPVAALFAFLSVACVSFAIHGED